MSLSAFLDVARGGFFDNWDIIAMLASDAYQGRMTRRVKSSSGISLHWGAFSFQGVRSEDGLFDTH